MGFSDSGMWFGMAMLGFLLAVWEFVMAAQWCSVGVCDSGPSAEISDSVVWHWRRVSGGVRDFDGEGLGIRTHSGVQLNSMPVDYGIYGIYGCKGYGHTRHHMDNLSLCPISFI